MPSDLSNVIEYMIRKGDPPRTLIPKLKQWIDQVEVSSGSGGDSASGIINDSGVSGAFVSDALDALAALDALKAPIGTQIIAGAGLTGGGTIASDRTLNVIANADGSIVVNANDLQVGILATDAQHGSRGGGSLHAAAGGGSSGFMTDAQSTKLAGIATGADVSPVSSVFGRTGAVVSAANDYAASQVSNDSGVTGSKVSDALNTTSVALASHVANVSNPHTVTATQVGLSAVTNDAQLKRAAADFQAFTAKTSPVGADILLIEDSAASSAKKYSTATQIVSGVAGGGVLTSIVFGATGTLSATGDITAQTGSDSTLALKTNRATSTATGITLGNSSTWTASSGTQVLAVASQTVNQSGTAGYTMLQVSATHTGVGSGTKFLYNATVDGSSVFSVNSAGAISLASSITAQVGNLNLNTAAVPAKVVLGGGQSTATGVLAEVTNLTGAWTGSSGIQQGFRVLVTANQSGTAGYNALIVEINHTATGSGTKNLISCTVGGTSQFAVSSVGKATAIGGLDVSGVAASASALTFTATSDTPATTWTAGVPSAATPAGFMRVTAGGATRYIAYWT